MQRFWNDEAGFIVSSELILIATVLVIGLLAGLVTIRDQVVQELGDVADAISEINQSYSFSGVTGHASSTAGTFFEDIRDFCEAAGTSDQSTGAEPQCIEISDINGAAEN